MFCNSSPISNNLLSLVLCKYVCIIFYSAVYIEQIRHKSVHKSSVPDSDTIIIIIIIIIVKAYLNVLFSCQICMFICMYVYMYVCIYVCMYQELLKKPQQIPRVFAHTWRIKLILILIL